MKKRIGEKMKKKKDVVFFLINSLEMGGAERVISELEPFLSKRYDFRILTLRESEKASSIKVGQKPKALLRTHSDVAMLLLWPLAVLRLKSIIRKENPLRVVSFLELSNFANLAAHRKGEAIISFRTSFSFFHGIKGAVYKLLIRLFYRRAKLIVFNSSENKVLTLRKFGLRKAKGSVARNPFNVSRIRSLAAKPLSASEKKMLAGKKVFLSMGRLNNEKNWDSLIKAFRHAVARDKRNVLVILGQGIQMDALKDLADHEGLKDNVFLLGRKDNVYPYLRRADYFIFNSPAEGFPNALIEAAACGLPIITNDFRTGARELIDPRLDFGKRIRYPRFGPNGVLLSSRNYASDLKMALEKTNFIKQGKYGLEHFEIKKVVSRWIDIIES